MDKNRLHFLLEKYFSNKIGSGECAELLAYLSQVSPDTISETLDEALHNGADDLAFDEISAKTAFEKIKADPRFKNSLVTLVPVSYSHSKFYQRQWFQIAASLLLFLSAGFYFLNKHAATDKPKKQKATIVYNKKPILPGGTKARLTLADGSVVILDEAKNGVIAVARSAVAKKAKDGLLTYQVPANQLNINSGSTQLVYNTISTPKGGEYKVILADGTRVWLNSASALSYPIEFTGTDRTVKLTGEAYFEVAKNASKPFNVSVNGVNVQVLGTHFDISSYNDEDALTATLLEGSIKISKNNNEALIKPGQQAIVPVLTNKIELQKANIEEVMAWKNGYFNFNDENVKSIMMKVARWYDIDVEYRGNVGNQKFGGTYYRYKGINELLNHLEKIGNLHFKIEGRRVIIMV